MAKNNKNNSKINKEDINLSSSSISSVDSKNIGILETGLHSETFEEFLQIFGDNKTSTIDILSITMSKNKININILGNMKVDIDSIMRYNHRDGLNQKTQEIITKKFLEKLWDTGRLDLPFRTTFEGNFGKIKQLVNKNLVFKDIQTSADEIIKNFPEITNNITVSNNEIFEGLNQQGFNINPVTNFNDHTLSDKKILAELVYFETSDAIENIKKCKSDLEKDMNLLLNQPISPIDGIKKYIDIANKTRLDYNKKSKHEDRSYPKEYQELLKSNEDVNVKKNELEDKLAESNYENKDVLNDIHNTNKDIWKNYIKYFESQKGADKDKKFLDILSKLVDNNFNFGELSQEEQNIFVQKTMADNINNLTDNKWVEGFGIDNTKYKEFLEKLIGFENKDENIIIPLPNGDEIKFKISKKFKEGENLNLLDYENFVETKNLPIIYNIEFDEDEEIMVNLNKILKNEENNKDNKIRLEGSDINKMNQLYVMSMAQSDTYKDIEDSKDSEEIKNIKKSLGDSSVEFRGGNDGIADAEKLFEDIENYHAYEDNQHEMYDEANELYNNLDTKGQEAFKERLLELHGESNEQQVKDAIEDVINELNNRGNDNYLDYEGTRPREQQETEEEKFMKSREGLSGNEFKGEDDKGFRKGTRLLINIGGSKLPPEDKGDSFFEIEIIKIPEGGTKFQVKIIGNELKNDVEGQTMRFPKTDEQLSLMKRSGTIYKLAAGNTKNWDSCIDNINASKIINKMTVFGTGDNQVIMKNGKFVNHEGEEIKYFSRSSDNYIGGKGQVKEYTNYKIKKINKSKGTVHVLCNFDGQDPDDISKQVNFKYDRELSYEQFILLMESKKTRGYTKDQKNEIFGTKGPNNPARLPNKGMLTFYSLGSIWGAVKNGAKKIKEKVTNVNEDEVADFENLLYSDEGLNLYGKIGSIFDSLVIFPGMSDAFKTAELEFYGTRESMTRKKIEHWYKIYEADPHFPTLWYKTLSSLLETPGYVGNDKNRDQVAAAFLILMKKDGPYGRGKLLQHMGKGYWVEKFLGSIHKKRFQKFFAERKQQLEEYGDINHIHWRKTRQDELNRLEFDYMIGVIDGRQPFGGHPGDDEHAQASMWSRNFATTLDENQKTYFTSFKEKADKIGPISFRQAEQEYFRMVTTGRFHKALPFLKRMAEDAQNKSEENRVKMNILGAILTGLFKNTQNADVMSEFWKISRTIGFLPGIWSRDNDQQDKIQKLLDGITSKPPFKKFSANANEGGTGYKKSDFVPGNWNKNQIKMKFLSTDLPQYWSKYGDKILDILEFRDMESENSIGNLANKGGHDAYIFQEIIDLSRESTKEDIDKNTSYTYGYYINSPWTANKGIVSDLVPRNGDYKGRETIEIEAAEEFWKSVSNKFETHRRPKSSDVEFYLGKFYNWFDDDVRDQSNITFLMRGLSLVKQLKLEGHTKEAEYQLWYLIKGSIYDKIGAMPPEFGASVDKFVSFFWNNVDHIDSQMISNTFGGEAAIGFKNPYGMLDWKGFWDNYMVFDGFGGGKVKSNYTQKYKIYEDNYINWKIDGIKKNLRRKGVSGMPSEPNKSNILVEHTKGDITNLELNQTAIQKHGQSVDFNTNKKLKIIDRNRKNIHDNLKQSA